ncbi:MAG: Bug family tripartite tricarboxylate transporter substrate binding protein [Xanthobacteraceae bacterium]
MTGIHRFQRLLCICIATLLCGTAALADDISDFYRGKTVSIYVGFPPGGGYDIYARVLAPYFARHIPGSPAVVVKNMTGGSGVRAAAYISNVTPQDGTSLGLFLDTTTIGKLLGGPGDFDPAKLVWIGRITSTDSVAMVWHTAPAQSIEEAKRTPITIAVTQPGASTSMIATALNDLIKTKFKIVRGYQGSPPMALAMERGEVDAMGGMSWDAVKTTKQNWLRGKKAKVLYTFGMRRLKDVPDASALTELAVDDRSRAILTLLAGGADVGRSLAAEPETPPIRAAALRKAFMATLGDPDFLADMHKRKLTVEPLNGAAVQKLIASAAATPRALVERAKRYVVRGGK